MTIYSLLLPNGLFSPQTFRLRIPPVDVRSVVVNQVYSLLVLGLIPSFVFSSYFLYVFSIQKSSVVLNLRSCTYVLLFLSVFFETPSPLHQSVIVGVSLKFFSTTNPVSYYTENKNLK